MTPRRAERVTTEAIYTCPHHVKTVGVVGKATKLYSIDLTTVHLNHAEKYGQPLALQWNWRPVPIGTHSTAGALMAEGNHGSHEARAAPDGADGRDPRSKTTKGSRIPQSRGSGGKAAAAVAVTETDDNSHYFRVGSSYSATWEVRVVYNHQELFVQRESIAASSAVTRKVLERYPTWASCSVILQDLPLKATIEVLVTCIDTSIDASDVSAQRARAKHFVGFQGVDLQLSPVPPKDMYRVGGDDASFSPDVNNLLGGCDHPVTSALQRQYPSLHEMQILRRLRWVSKCPSSRAVLSWKAKLTSSFVGFKSSAATTKRAAGADEMPPNHLSLGYSWAVHVLSAAGGESIAAEGLCVGGLDSEPTAGGAADDAAGSAQGEDSKLRAWMWKDCAAAVTNLHQDDWVLLVAKPMSQQPNYPAAALASCAVGVKDCGLYFVEPESAHTKPTAHSNDNLHHSDVHHQAALNLDSSGVTCDGASAMLYAWHDDARLQLPF